VMQALHYTRWFTKASISGQKKRTKQQQQQTNKSNAYGRIRMLLETKGQQEKYTELRSSEFRAGTQRERERDTRNKEKDICERERYIARAQRRIQNMFRQKTEKGIKQREIYII
jgi:hypothetical protein